MSFVNATDDLPEIDPRLLDNAFGYSSRSLVHAPHLRSGANDSTNRRQPMVTSLTGRRCAYTFDQDGLRPGIAVKEISGDDPVIPINSTTSIFMNRYSRPVIDRNGVDPVVYEAVHMPVSNGIGFATSPNKGELRFLIKVDTYIDPSELAFTGDHRVIARRGNKKSIFVLQSSEKNGAGRLVARQYLLSLSPDDEICVLMPDGAVHSLHNVYGTLKHTELDHNTVTKVRFEFAREIVDNEEAPEGLRKVMLSQMAMLVEYGHVDHLASIVQYLVELAEKGGFKNLMWHAQACRVAMAKRDAHIESGPYFAFMEATRENPDIASKKKVGSDPNAATERHAREQRREARRAELLAAQPKKGAAGGGGNKGKQDGNKKKRR